jgi:hypothetical protein
MSDRERTFRRSLSIRLVSLLTTLAFAFALAVRLAAGEVRGGFWVVAVLLGLSLVGLIGAWGDRVRLDEDGVEVRNVLWSLLRRPGRRLAWRDVVAVHEHRRIRPGGGEAPVSALFLVPRAGRRLVLDSLRDFDEVLRLVARHRGAPVSNPSSDRPR